MKVAFFMSTPFSLGGEQRVVSVVSNILINLGHEVTIICINDKVKQDYNLYNLDKNVKIINMPPKNSLNKLQNILYRGIRRINRKYGILKNNIKLLEKFWTENYTKRRLIKIINNNQFDVVIGVAGYNSLILAMIKNKIPSKIIGWQHSSFKAYFRTKDRYHYNQDEIFKKYIPMLDDYIVLTNQDKKAFKEEFEITCTTIYNPKSFVSLNVSTLQKKTFLSAGRFAYVKGYDMLIDSFEIFARENKEWNLVIVGEGEEKNKIKDKIKEYNLEDRVQIHDFTKNIQEYFLNSSALLLSSRWEGMPMIVLEAMEMGVPVISYKIPVMEEILEDQKDSLLVNEFNIEEYSQKMKEYANNRELREKLARNIKKKSEQFNYETIGEKWKEILVKVKGN